MNAAIYYFADGFDTSWTKLMGRHAAGEEFLKGWARHSKSKNFYCYAKDDREFHHFTSRIKSAGSTDIAWGRAATNEEHPSLELGALEIILLGGNPE